MPRLDPQGVFTVVLLVGTAMTGALGTTTPTSAIGARSTGAATAASTSLGPDGIRMLYATVNDDMSWYASWTTNRSIASSGVDPVDSRSRLRGTGLATLAGGVMTLSGIADYRSSTANAYGDLMVTAQVDQSFPSRTRSTGGRTSN